MMLTTTENSTSGDPMAVFDAVLLGKRLRQARHYRGYERVDEMLAEIKRTLGETLSKRSVYAVERGEMKVSAEMLYTLLLFLEPPEGVNQFLEPAVMPGKREAFEKIIRRP